MKDLAWKQGKQDEIWSADGVFIGFAESDGWARQIIAKHNESVKQLQTSTVWGKAHIGEDGPAN